MSNLESLPNIGKVLASRLRQAGVETAEELQQIGDAAAFLRIRATLPDDACVSTRYALAGAVRRALALAGRRPAQAIGGRSQVNVLMLDVDGVLVGGRPQDGEHLFTDLEADLGISRSLLQAAFFDVYWQEIIVGRDALKPRLSAVLGKIAPGLEAQRLIDYWFANDSRIDADVLAAVDALRLGGTKVYLATNQEHLRARYLMEDMGLGAHVDGILYSAALGYRKPMPEFYRLAGERAGAAGNEIMFVDDVAANIEAAKLAGWNAVLWTGKDRLGDLAR